MVDVVGGLAQREPRLRPKEFRFSCSAAGLGEANAFPLRGKYQRIARASLDCCVAASCVRTYLKYYLFRGSVFRSLPSTRSMAAIT